MSTKRLFFLDAFMTAIIHILFFGVFAAVMVAFLDVQRLGMLLGLVVVAAFYFLVARRAVKPVISMVIAHLAAPAAVWWLVPISFGFNFELIIIIILTFVSLYLRYKKPSTFTSEFTNFASGALVAIAAALGHAGHIHVIGLYIVLIGAVVIGARLHIRMHRVHFLLDVLTHSSVQPVNKIIGFDNKIMIMLGAVLVGIVLFIYQVLLRPLARFLSGINISLISNREPTIAEHTPIQHEAPMQVGSQYANWAEGMEPSVIAQAIVTIFTYAFLASLVVGAIYTVYIIIRALYRRFRLEKGHVIATSDGHEDIKEFIRTPKAMQKRRIPRGEQRIRRLFRETVTRHIKKGVPIQKSDTPVQMSDKIVAEDITALVDEYSSVRYKA